MTITEFINKYEFHDSSLLKVKYENNQLVLTVEFCFWMQSWFDEKSLNNGKIMVIFNNVSSFDYDDNIADKLLTDILDSEIFDVDFNLDWREIPHFYKWWDESPLFC